MKNTEVKTKKQRLLSDQLVPTLLLALFPPLPWPLPWLPPPLPLLSPPCRRLPLPAPWSSCRPDIGTILTKGAWCHSLLLFNMHSAFEIIILTASLTCLTRGGSMHPQHSHTELCLCALVFNLLPECILLIFKSYGSQML